MINTEAQSRRGIKGKRTKKLKFSVSLWLCVEGILLLAVRQAFDVLIHIPRRAGMTLRFYMN